MSSRQEYREWVALLAWATLVGLLELGMSTEVTRRKASDAADDIARTAVHLLAAVGAIVVATVAVFRGPLSHALVSHPSAAFQRALVLITIVAVGQVVSGIWGGSLRGAQRGDVAEVIRTCAAAVGALAALCVLAAQRPVDGLPVAIGVEVLCAGLATRLALARYAPGPGSRERTSARELIAFSVASALLALSQLSAVVDTEFDKIVLAHARSAAELVSYNVTATTATQLRILVGTMMVPLLAAVARLGDGEASDRIWAPTTTFLTMVGTAALGVLAALSPWCASFLDGGRGSATAPALAGNCLAAAVNLAAAGAAFRAVAAGDLRPTALASALNIVLNASVAVVLTPRFGLVAAVGGSVVANAAATVWFLIALRPHPRYAFDLRPSMVVGSVAIVATGGALAAPPHLQRWCSAGSALLIVGIGAVYTGVRFAPFLRDLRTVLSRPRLNT
jgi:O-antigen/teichoic acid export membrane protein